MRATSLPWPDRSDFEMACTQYKGTYHAQTASVMIAQDTDILLIHEQREPAKYGAIDFEEVLVNVQYISSSLALQLFQSKLAIPSKWGEALSRAVWRRRHVWFKILFRCAPVRDASSAPHSPLSALFRHLGCLHCPRDWWCAAAPRFDILSTVLQLNHSSRVASRLAVRCSEHHAPFAS